MKPASTLLAAFLLAAFLPHPARAALASKDAAPPAPEWIWGAPVAQPGDVFHFRTAFNVSGPVRLARLAGACDRRMAVFVNGRPAATIENFDKPITTDVTAMLRGGMNHLAVRAEGVTNRAAVLLRLTLTLADGREQQVVSDGNWLASAAGPKGWHTTEFVAAGWARAHSFGRAGVETWGDPFDPTRAADAYNSWKGSLGAREATPAAGFTLLPGFTATLVRSAREEEGSWVSLAFDPQGRLTLAREKNGLVRLTFDKDGGVAKVETLNTNLLECRGQLYAHGSLYVNANNSKALYRLRETKGGGEFDEVTLLRESAGGVGHGRNQLVLGPDQKIYGVHGNNVRQATNGTVSPASPHRGFQEDQLIPCPWDARLFDSDAAAPAGHAFRMDADGGNWELLAGGFRNPYDLAFNPDGELFTFDADMEWDTGSPWYRPNRVLHIVSGGEYGWRRGTGPWPAFYADSLPATRDIGLASPTGVKFGTGSQFPPRYQRALFICDWAFGRIIAVHLTPAGASYSATSEHFLTGRPVNVTDLDIGPDGAMYFITGGRRTQSGLYRVTWTGPRGAEPAKSAAEVKAEKEAAAARALRRSLEAFHGRRDPRALEAAWLHLDSSDRFLRHAARIAVEHQDVALWQERALAEQRNQGLLTALLALARCGSPAKQPALLAALERLPWQSLTEAQQLEWLRVQALCFIRMGRPEAATAAQLAARVGAFYPSSSRWVNQELCRTLVYLDAPDVVIKTLPLLAAAPTQEEQMHYMFLLRSVAQGWTAAQRRTYFDWFDRAAGYKGGVSFPKFIADIKADAIATLNPTERATLALRLGTPAGPAKPAAPMAARPFVKEWKMADLLPGLDQAMKGRSLTNGKAAFVAGQCLSCHRMSNDGAAIGPDLGDVGRRFDRRALLESMLEPSRVMDDKFRQTHFKLKDGTTVTGQLARSDDTTLFIRANPLSEELTKVAKANVQALTLSPLSPMPEGLLNSLGREDVLDLLAYLESGGDPSHAAFKR